MIVDKNMIVDKKWDLYCILFYMLSKLNNNNKI